MNSQSAGLLESVFLGKEHPLVQHGMEKMVAHLPFLLQPLRRDWHQAKCRFVRDFAHRPSKIPCCHQLPFRPVGDDAQIHITVRSRFPARVGTEKIDGVNMPGAVERFETLRQRLPSRLQRSR